MMKRPLPPTASGRRDHSRSQGGDGSWTLGRWSAGRSRYIGNPPRRSRWGSILLFGGLTLAALAAVIVGFALGMVPASLVRDELVRDVKAQTGRDLVVAGQTSVSFFPSLAVTMSDVSLSPPPGMAGEPMVRIRRVDASVPFSALFTSRVVVTRLLLTDPVFTLRVDAHGRRNWDGSARPSGAPAGAGPGSGPNSALRSRSIDDTAIEEIRIVNGTVRFLDERTGARHEATGLDVTIAGATPTGPLEATGSVLWRNEAIRFAARLATSAPNPQHHPLEASLALRSRHFTLDYHGMVKLTDTVELDGTLTLGTPSLKDAVTWLDAAPPAARDLGAIVFKSKVRSAPASIALSDTELTLAGASATGSIGIDTSGTRPKLRADLKVSALDLDAYVAPTGSPDRPGPPSAPSDVSGRQPERAWSEKKVDLALFALADIEAKLALGKLTYGGMKFGATSATLSLKDRVLRFTLDDARLYEGRSRGVISIDATGDEPAIAADLVFDQVSLLPMLTDAAGFDWLAGKANLQLRLAGRGASERAIVESLSGSAAVRVLDGAIVGVNIPQVVRSLRQGRFSDFAQVGTEKTDFTEMTASFRIERGVAETQDLSMLSPLMRLTATGTVDLGRRQLDATLRPRLVGSLSGQGGAQDLAGLELPIRLSGPWSEPQLSADIDAVLKDPDKAVEAIKQIGKQLEESGLGEALRKLLGDDKGASKSGKSGSFLDEIFK